MYGVEYPISGVHECPFGWKQARDIQFMAMINGVIDPKIVAREEEHLPWNYI